MVDPLDKAIRLCGLGNLADACGVSQQAVAKWRSFGLPQSEWTGRTSYSSTIERETKGAVTREQLLATTPRADRQR